MPSFKIAFDGNEPDNFGTIQFDADSPGQALSILERKNVQERAVLWEGDKRLGALSRCEAGYWRIEP